MHRADPSLPLITSRAQARASGMTDRQVSRRLASGEWTAARRDCLVAPPADGSKPDPLDLAVLAAVRSVRREVAIAGPHAARIWDLPRPLDGWGPPTLLAFAGPTRIRSDILVRVTELQDGDILQFPNGVLVTSPLRTVADCLRQQRAPDALATVDAAHRSGLVTTDELRSRVGGMGGWPGVAQARRLLRLADGRRETPLESWSALAFDDHGVPSAEPQVNVWDDVGLVGRVDLRWDCGLVGESDGRVKYLLQAAERGGVDAEGLAAVLGQERERERRLRATGAFVVRWEARDVLVPAAAERLAVRVRRELQAQERSVVTGRAASTALDPTPGIAGARRRAALPYRPFGSGEGGWTGRRTGPSTAGPDRAESNDVPRPPGSHLDHHHLHRDIA